MKQSCRPRRPQQHLLVQHLGSETLIYDERRHQAFCLDPISSAVWKNSDGERTVADLAAVVSEELAQPLGCDAVRHALRQLDAANLLESKPVAALSRRSLLAQAGATAAFVVPAIAMIGTPTAAQAYNGCLDCDSVPKIGTHQIRAAKANSPIQPVSSSHSAAPDNDLTLLHP